MKIFGPICYVPKRKDSLTILLAYTRIDKGEGKNSRKLVEMCQEKAEHAEANFQFNFKLGTYDTNSVIYGFKIPYFEELKQMINECFQQRN